MWIGVNVSNAEKVQLANGRYQLALDNRILHLNNEWVQQVAAGLPVNKSWQGKEWRLEKAWVDDDGGKVWLEFVVTRNLLPMVAVIAGIGVVGVVAAVYLVRELRRFVDVKGIVQSPAVLLGAGALLTFVVGGVLQSTRGQK